VTARTNIVKQVAVASVLATALACGGSGGGSNNPNTPGSGGGTPGPVGATITIGANDTVSPSTVTINPGESVTFVNNGTRSHQMASDPHPAHTDCPAINALGVVDRGQSRSTNALTASRTCGFHDHNEDTNAGLRGSIVIR
jgi:plastocyanin